MYLSQAEFSNRIFQLKFGWVSNLTLVFYMSCQLISFGLIALLALGEEYKLWQLLTA
jgi:hypothetical protein